MGMEYVTESKQPLLSPGFHWEFGWMSFQSEVTDSTCMKGMSPSPPLSRVPNKKILRDPRSSPSMSFKLWNFTEMVARF
jgi:hypothetical protein